MMQITDEMVEAAWRTCSGAMSPREMRAALEAALKVGGNAAELPAKLRNIFPPLRHDCLDAATCIEELAAALRPFSSEVVSDSILDEREDNEPYMYMRPVTVGDLRHARDVLAKWRLK